MSCTPETFVRVWQTAASIADVAAELGMREDAARSRACDYRRRGIPLKKFSRARPDVPALAKLAIDLAAHHDDSRQLTAIDDAFADVRGRPAVIGIRTRRPR